MPVQSYSAGMTVRLSFAVATAINPDVLIVDEVFQAAKDILEKNPKSASCRKKQNLTSR
jgi:ABC-type polysaccharide/polyol phosphate transport system ATPase subunit